VNGFTPTVATTKIIGPLTQSFGRLGSGAPTKGIEGVAGGFEVVRGGRLVELANYRKVEGD
jgi:hypothetical protein